jgi:N-acetylglucosamine kinase-like BadF-type ATPase
VAVNAGTAAAIAARGPDGATWDMGWWGQHAMGALGLVSESFKAVYLAHLGAAPQTALGPALVRFYGTADLAELNRLFTRRGHKAGTADMARAARVVTETAKQGDPVAADIVHEQGRRLAFYAEIAARHAGLDRTDGPIPVVMSGSVLADRDSPVTAALAGHLPRMLPRAEPRHATLPPVAGAALDALAEGGVAVGPAVAGRLAATIPPPSFFLT